MPTELVSGAAGSAWHSSSGNRVAVVGAGSLGLYLGGRLALAGHSVTLVLRPDSPGTLPGLRAEGDETWQLPVGAEASPGRVGIQRLGDALAPVDQVIVAVKSQDLAAVAPHLAALGQAGSDFIFLQNGIPWWWGGAAGQRSDPAGVLARTLAPEQVVAAVVYHAVERLAPGHIRLRRVADDRYVLGWPGDSRGGAEPAARLKRLAATWCRAGIPTALAGVGQPTLRGVVWDKLSGNAAFNPLCALTGLDLDQACALPSTRATLLAAMTEVARVADADGVAGAVSPADRLARAERLKGARPSMLQDRLAGRPLEIDALVGAVLDIAADYDVPTPVLSTLHACLQGLAVR